MEWWPEPFLRLRVVSLRYIRYLRDKNIPVTQRRAIEAHYSLLWGKTAIYDEAEILGQLPRALRDPLLQSLYIGFLGTHLFVHSEISGSYF